MSKMDLFPLENRFSSSLRVTLVRPRIIGELRTSRRRRDCLIAGHAEYMVSDRASNPSMKADFARRKMESRRPARRGGSSRAVGFFLISLAFLPGCAP